MVSPRRDRRSLPLLSHSFPSQASRRTLVIALALGWVMALPAAGFSQRSPQTTKPKVVATTSILCDLTRQIAGSTIQLTCLLPAGLDPHIYQPKPSDRRAIDTAQLVLYSGYNLESDLIPLISASRTFAPKIAVAERAVPRPLGGHAHHHSSADHHHHEPNQADPHVFHDASHGSKMVQVIGQSLQQLQPSQRQTYDTRIKTLTQEINQLHRWIKAQIQTIPVTQRWLATTHHSFGYYAQAYGLALSPTLQGLSTDEKPSAQRIALLAQELKTLKIRTVFAESNVNPRLIQTLAKEAGAKVSPQRLYADGLGPAGSEADSYQAMLMANTKAITEGLGGRFRPFRS